MAEFDRFIGYVAVYMATYAVLAGVWNLLFTMWTCKRIDKIMESDDWLSVQAEYGLRLQNSWICKMCSNLCFKPLVDVLCIMLWPIMLPAQAITGLYYAIRYLKVPKKETSLQEEAA